MMQNLTPKQINVIRIIREFWLKNGYAPTLQEIATELDASAVTALEYIKTLTKKGVISIEKGQRRSIKIIDPDYLPKKLYKHYKGGLYEVVYENAILKDAGPFPDEPCIIYKSIKDGKVYVRTAKNFHGNTDILPGGQAGVKRFTEIDPFNPFNEAEPDAKEV